MNRTEFGYLSSLNFLELTDTTSSFDAYGKPSYNATVSLKPNTPIVIDSSRGLGAGGRWFYQILGELINNSQDPTHGRVEIEVSINPQSLARYLIKNAGAGLTALSADKLYLPAQQDKVRADTVIAEAISEYAPNLARIRLNLDMPQTIAAVARNAERLGISTSEPEPPAGIWATRVTQPSVEITPDHVALTLRAALITLQTGSLKPIQSVLQGIVGTPPSQATTIKILQAANVALQTNNPMHMNSVLQEIANPAASISR